MNKKVLLLMMAALVTANVFAGGSKEKAWIPSETYAKWCRAFHMDKVWKFNDAGSADNDPSNPDDGVTTETCPMYLSFSLMSWKDRNTPDDYNLRTAYIELYDEAKQDEHKICKLTFSDDYNGDDNISNVYTYEGNVTGITNFNKHQTWCVQKRMNKSYLGGWGAQFCYFVTQYDQSLVTFINNATSGRLMLRIICEWDNLHWASYDERATITLMPLSLLTDPTLTVPTWLEKNGKTSLSYTMTQANQGSKTIVTLQDVTTGKSAEVYNGGDNFTSGTPAVNQLGTVTRTMLEQDELKFSAQVNKTYAINQSHWKLMPSSLSKVPTSQTIYSLTTEVKVPQFCQPFNLRVENNGNGVNKLKWTTSLPAGSSYDASGFIVERSHNEDFSTIDVQQAVSYKSSETEYCWEDKYTDRNQGTLTYYYRLHRANAAIAEPLNSLSYSTMTNYVTVADFKVEEHKGQALVRWKLSADGLWTENMKLQLAYGGQTKLLPRDSTQALLTLKPCTPTPVTLSVLDNGEEKNFWQEIITLSDTIPGALHITTSKGYYNDHVDIDWTIPADSANFASFNITRMDRRDMGKTSKWTHLGSVDFNAGVLSYHFQDNTCVPGVYYNYKVSGISVCDKTPQEKANEVAIGFAQPYGVLTGQVHYGSNQGVEGIKISALGSTERKGRSLHLGSTASSFAQMNASFANSLLEAQSGTMEMWLKPETSQSDQVILYREGCVDWRISTKQEMSVTLMSNDAFRLTIALKDSNSSWKDYQFNHVAFSYKVENKTLHLLLLINGSVAGVKDIPDCTAAYDTKSTKSLRIGNDKVSNYNGYIDEIRFWNIYRDSIAVNKTLDCYLSGSEYSLTGYYRCDDENTGELYDISRTNSSFNSRHMTMNDVLLDESNIPTTEQLSLAARTDKNGNYILNAVPYSAEGSLYTIVPSSGVHVFAPTNQPLFFDKSASTHNSINFTDQSSFEVSGYVYYENTNYPVEGCMFAVDGATCTSNNRVVKTDAEGHYTISVPVGKHSIQMTLEGHTFSGEGRFPAKGEVATTYDFQAPKNDVNFTDVTRVTLTGRVAGGTFQDSLPHGMQQGTNNIGQARVVISPVVKGKYDLNLLDTTRVWAIPDSCKVQSKSTTGKPMTDAGRYVVIVTDPKTGEFSVKLPPIDMSVDSITIPSNPVATQSLSPSMYGTIELSDMRQNSMHIDSTVTESGKKCFTYAKALDINYRVAPTLQVKDKAHEDDMFGLTETSGYNKLRDTTVVIPLIGYDSVAGKNKYLYDYPYFQQNSTYNFTFRCYEEYTNADNPQNIVVDQVPVKNSLVTVYNGAGESLSGSIYTILDAKGEGSYGFQAGEPNIMPTDSLTTQYLRSFSISYTDSKQEASYNWSNNKNASCVVLGVVNIDGQNFITEGPDEVLFVLRDPPGSKSFAKLTKSTQITKTTSITTTKDNAGGGELFCAFGPTIKTMIGFGVLNMFAMETKDELVINPFGGQGTIKKNTTSMTFGLSEEILTSTGEWYDGASGDVFIGLSTNFNYGDVKHLGFNYNDSLKAYVLSVTNKTAISKEYSTDFYLSQYQLENVQIPNMVRQRNDLIQIVSHECYVHYRDSIKPHKTDVIYISEISPSDSHFAQEGYYIAIPPSERAAMDKVCFYNSQIASWKKIMADNEKVKVQAIEQGKYKSHRNISVDGGVTYTSSSDKTEVKEDEHTDTDHFQIAISDRFGFQLNGVGVNITGKYEHNWQKEVTTETDTSRTQGVAYTFDLGDNEQLSIDVYEGADAFGPIFATSAGQTECPYEGAEVTKYFEPGQHTISAATQKLCDPEIAIEGAAVVSGVPVGGKATYTVQLRNKSNTTTYTTMRLKQASGSNPYGAEINVDGMPLTEIGIPMVINPGTQITKTITLSQTDLSYLDFNNIGLIWCSDCSPVKTADTTYITAHFVSACSSVQLSVDRLIVNAEHPTLNLTVKGYDVTSPTLKAINLEYRESSDPLFRYQIKQLSIDTLKQCPQLLTYGWDMSALLDGTYDVRATTICQIGSETIYGEGEVFTITKDVTSPVSLGLPSPINGIYTNDNEIYVMTNEPIQTAKIIASNVSVKGQLNAHKVSHDVAFHYGDSTHAYSETNMYLSSDAFSLEFWLNYNKPGTIWYHGKFQGLSLAIDDAGYLKVKSGNSTVTSTIQVPKDEWVFVLMNCEKLTDSTSTVTLHLAAGTTDSKQSFTIPSYAKTAPIFVGWTGNGYIQELMMTPSPRQWEMAKIESQQSHDLYTDVLGYWPLDEGQGKVAKDRIRHRNLSLTGQNWYLAGTNYAYRITSATTIPLQMPVVSHDYALEMWLRMDGDGELFHTSDSSFILSFTNGSVQVVVNHDTLNTSATAVISDNAWHSLTILGNKNGKMVFFLDGVRKEFANYELIPNLSQKSLVFGARNPIEIDELRLWNSDMSESWLNYFRYCQLGDEALTTYKERLAVYKSFNDIAAADRASSAAPLRSMRETSDVDHTVTASSTAVFINITEPAYRIEGCTLEFCVNGLIDLHGNYSGPITWTAYVNRNQLLWSESEQQIVKENLESYTFPIDVVNNSGKVENWSISNVPEWLSFSEVTGITQPLSETHLTATVDPALAIGNYEQVVYLTGNKGIQEPLYVSVQVTGDAPDWSIDPSDYEHSMNVIAIATMNGTSMDDSQDLVAAFVNNKLAGVAHPQYVRSDGKYFVMMDIYSNATSGDVSFRYWDASTGSTYSNIGIAIDGKEPVTSIAFQTDKVYGSTTNPVYLTLSNTMDLSVNLDKGWNWVSFNVLDSSLNVAKQLANIVPAMRLIKSDKQYAEVIDNTLLGTLTKLDYASAYKISATKDCEAYVSGIPADALKVGIELKQKAWNWIGFVPQMSLHINTALASLTPTEGDVVKAQTGFATWNGHEWLGSLKAMRPGEGYLYYNAGTTPQTLYYPSTAVLTNSSLLFAPRWVFNTQSAFTPVDPRTYQGNMTITAKVMNGAVEVKDAEVGIFAGNECRAAATYLTSDSTDAGAYFILVPGDESVPLTIQVTQGGKTVTLEQSITFVDDAMIGSLAEPYIIQIGSAQGIQAETSETRNLKQGTSYKFLKDGILYIVHDGQVYTAEGAAVEN